jgi:hypothetical protein
MSKSSEPLTRPELVIYTAMGGFGIWLVYLIGWIPSPIAFTDVWTTHGSMWDGLTSVWYIFVWGLAITMVISLASIIKRQPRSVEPGELLMKGIAISLFAGVVEELAFRWFLLFGGMFALTILNFITFGLVEWVNTWALIPLTNWLTFGMLSPQLTGYGSWVFGAAIIFANGSFRDAHESNGLFAYLNAWAIGIVFFYLMFNYGLLTAIVAHVLYDLCIFTTAAIGMAFQPRMHKYGVGTTLQELLLKRQAR